MRLATAPGAALAKQSMRDSRDSGNILSDRPRGGLSVTRRVIQADKGAPPRGAYSHGWRARDFIYVTGTGPIGPDGPRVPLITSVD